MVASDMSPPVKRRKLSDSTAEDRYRDDDGGLDGMPAYAQAVEAYHRHRHQVPSRAGAHIERRGHVQEIKQESANDGGEVLLQRQDTNTPVPSVPAIPTFGVQTFSYAFTTITFTPPATPSLPTLPLVPGATTVPTASQADPTAAPPSSISSPDPSAIPPTNGTLSSSSSSSSNLMTSGIFRSNSTMTLRTISTATETSVVFLATLGNGDVSTITRSSTTFTTTLSGSTFTVSGYGSSQTSTSSQGRETVTSTLDVPAGGVYGTPTGPSSSTTTATDSDDGGSDTPPAGTIAGGVVGGAAGLAVLVLIAMLFVRWYRRNGQTGHQALPANSMSSPDLSRDGAPGMAERAGMIPFAAAVPALFRHGNRGELAEPTERGFTRVSGRKLPSQWSEGMSSPPLQNMPLTAQTSGPEAQRNLSNASFYRDSHGFYGGDGGETTSPLGASPSSDGQGPLRSNSGDITMSPGPERHPTFHLGGPYHVSHPRVASGGFGRSDTPSSLDPARSSRFTEDM